MRPWDILIANPVCVAGVAIHRSQVFMIFPYNSNHKITKIRTYC